MTRFSDASAPGKVVLAGEYAVLDGAPAIALAVDRRAFVRIASAGRSATDAMLADSLPATALRVLNADAELPLHCDTDAFFDRETGAKLGLGSSAALTVAICAAILNRTDVAVEADQVHREWQQGAGSGIDIACAVHGGLILYRRDATVVERLEWPQGLYYRLIWTGVPASTRDKLKLLSSHDATPSRQRLVVAADAAARAWGDGADAVIEQLPDFIAHLREFSADYGLGVFDAGHDQLARSAVAERIVYKPCGAGGGDIGVALSTDAERLDHFVARRKLNVLNCTVAETGVRLES